MRLVKSLRSGSLAPADVNSSRPADPIHDMDHTSSAGKIHGQDFNSLGAMNQGRNSNAKPSSCNIGKFLTRTPSKEPLPDQVAAIESRTAKLEGITPRAVTVAQPPKDCLTRFQRLQRNIRISSRRNAESADVAVDADANFLQPRTRG